MLSTKWMILFGLLGVLGLVVMACGRGEEGTLHHRRHGVGHRPR